MMVQHAPNLSSATVGEATGRSWDEWVELLEESAGPDGDRRTVVSAVADAGVENGWWQQQIAVGYESERSGAQGSETPGAGCELGLQCSIDTDRETLWTYLVEDGVVVWLGDVDGQFPAPNTRYETADGTTGEMQFLEPEERIRLSWHPDRLDEPAVLQLTLSSPGDAADGTTLRVDLEQLPDATVRDALRIHWRAVLDRIQADLAP